MEKDVVYMDAECDLCGSRQGVLDCSPPHDIYGPVIQTVLCDACRYEMEEGERDEIFHNIRLYGHA